MILSSGNFSPIVPVDANKISEGLIFIGFSSSILFFSDSCTDKKSAKFTKLLNPFSPVKAFAFLVFTSSALIFLLLIFMFHFIFSEIIFDCVYTDA